MQMQTAVIKLVFTECSGFPWWWVLNREVWNSWTNVSYHRRYTAECMSLW